MPSSDELEHLENLYRVDKDILARRLDRLPHDHLVRVAKALIGKLVERQGPTIEGSQSIVSDNLRRRAMVGSRSPSRRTEEPERSAANGTVQIVEPHKSQEQPSAIPRSMYYYPPIDVEPASVEEDSAKSYLTESSNPTERVSNKNTSASSKSKEHERAQLGKTAMLTIPQRPALPGNPPQRAWLGPYSRTSTRGQEPLRKEAEEVTTKGFAAPKGAALTQGVPADIAVPVPDKIPLKDIYFYQDYVSPQFMDGRSLKKTIDELRNGTVTPETLPPIYVGRFKGRWYGLGNRRLSCFHYVYKDEPGRLIPVQAYNDVGGSANFHPQGDGLTVRLGGGMMLDGKAVFSMKHCSLW
jgi:hypothetical protein